MLKVVESNAARDGSCCRALTRRLPEDIVELLELIGAKRGCLRSSGAVDREKARRIILTDFRSNKLGQFTLNTPDQLEIKESDLTTTTE